MRRRLLGSCLVVSALAAVSIAVPTVAGASATLAPYFLTWKPGTPLPAVPAGYKLVAIAPQPKSLTVGHALTMTTLRRSLATRRPGAYSAFATKAGVINLEAEPSVGCTPLVFIANEGSHTGIVMQSFSTIAGVKQTFTYGNGQSTTLAVGLSTTGGAGSCSANGSTSVSTDFEQGFDPQNGRSFNHWQTWFQDGEYDQLCPLGYYYPMT